MTDPTRLTLTTDVRPPAAVPSQPRRRLVEHQAHLEATGDPDRIRVQWWDTHKTRGGSFRLVLAGEGHISLDRLEREFVAQGWHAVMPDYWPRFKAAVLAGRRYDPFAAIERSA